MDVNRTHYRAFSTWRFRNAPICKYWSACLLLGSCCLIPFTNGHYFISYPHSISLDLSKVLSLLSSQLFFCHVHSIILGVSIVYHCRNVERLFGSRKFLNFLTLSFFGVKATELALVFILKSCNFSLPYFLVPGPYGVLASCLVQYFIDTPYVVVGTLFASRDLFFWSIPTLLSFVSGLLFGVLYRRAPLLQRFNILPSFLSNVGRLLRPLSDLFEDKCGMNLPIAATRDGQRLELADRLERSLISMQMRHTYQQQISPTLEEHRRLPFLDRVFNRNNIVISDSNISALMDMGFSDRETVRQALVDCHDDLSTAAEQLLNQHR